MCHVRYCPIGQVFDPVRLICDDPTTVKTCGKVSTTPSEPSSVHPLCSGKVDGDYPVGDCVSKYLWCHSGVPSDKFCADPLVFDSDTRRCAEKWKVKKCQTGDPQCAGRGPGDFALAPCDPAYIWCSADQLATVRGCPEGLVFLETGSQCVRREQNPNCPTTTTTSTTRSTTRKFCACRTAIVNQPHP